MTAPGSSSRAARRGGAALATQALASRGFVLASTLALALTVVAALVERNVGSWGAVDRTLSVVVSWVVPLLSLAIVSLVVGPRRLRDATWPVARFGAPRLQVALGLMAVVIAACALASVAVASVAVLLGHTASAPPLASDLATTAWIAALTGAAYGAWLSLGASFGRSGGGRYVILVLDFVLGGTDVLGAVLPRGDAASLLGLAAPFAGGQRLSSALLAGLALAVFAVAAWRSRD